MAYNNFYPNYYQQFPQIQPQLQPQAIPQAQPQQIQNGGFISVRSEAEARNYPIAPGNSITFKDETAPYCYTKTMGFSQLDMPVFEKYRLVKEENAPVSGQTAKEGNDMAYATQEQIEAVRAEIGAIKEELKLLKKEGAENEHE